MIHASRRLWSGFVRVSKPLWTSSVRWRAAGWFIALVVLLLGLSGLNVINSYVARDFMTAIAERLPHLYLWLALLYLGVFAASTLAGGLQRFAELRLGLLWREWLTQYVSSRYLSRQAYYRVNHHPEIDNPDQRISEDIRSFTTTSLSFVIILLSSAITVAAFAGVLWSITPWLFLVAVLYPAGGTVLALIIGRRLVSLNNLQLKKEADFRFELVRVREHADSLVLAHREDRQESLLRERLAALVDNYSAIIAILRNLKFFSGGYNFLTQLIPVMIVAPLYMRGDVEFGVIAQATMAFSQVFNAFSLVVEQLQDISAFAAVINRLSALLEAIDEPEQEQPIHVVMGKDQVAFQHVTLRTPKEGRVIIHDLSFEVRKGQRLLVTGLQGAGKSILLRATAGVWEWGQGQILRPDWKHILFLPERPYLVSGTLRAQFHFPGKEASDEQILSVLRAVKLDSILSRAGSLDAEEDWANALSLGEQQLLALAGVLLAKPTFVFLDHAMTALDAQQRKTIYQQLSETSMALISVAAPYPDLLAHHDTLLEIHDNGEWTTSSLQVAAEGFL